MIRVLLLVIGYCLGMIQTGYLYGRMKGIDIRKAGSGNSGATNSLRVLGKKAGLIVFAVDLCKCFIPCLIVKAWAVSSGQQHMEDIYMLYLAFGVILGHNYPCYLNFKGGKGISSTSGFILAFDLRIAAVSGSIQCNCWNDTLRIIRLTDSCFNLLRDGCDFRRKRYA